MTIAETQNLMTEIQNAYNRRLFDANDRSKLHTWHRILEPDNAEDILAALAYWCRTSPYPPNPAQLLDIAPQQPAWTPDTSIHTVANKAHSAPQDEWQSIIDAHNHAYNTNHTLADLEAEMES